jgi:hypothetical protein
MRPGVIALAALCGVGCEPVVFRLDPPAAPPATTPSPTPVAASACASGCVGGRSCVRGACLPHWLPLAAPEVASSDPRVGHYAVWTGAEVIVWGGHDPRPGRERHVYGDGLRIDLARGEVRAITRLAAPVARYDDGSGAAVWTGREMVIWGGRGGTGALTDGAAYVPSLDAWVQPPQGPTPSSAVATVVTRDGLVFVPLQDPDATWRASTDLSDLAPLGARGGVMGARRGHASVFTGSELFVWGGLDERGQTRDDGWRFSPSRRRSRALPTAGAPAPRAWHTATWAESQVFVFGGRDATGRALAAPQAYTPATDAWREVTATGAPAARYGHVAAWTGDALLVWGGADEGRVFDDGALYDPWDDAWRPLPALNADDRSSTAREGAVGVWTGTELVVVGGWDRSDRATPLGWRYQP